MMLYSIYLLYFSSFYYGKCKQHKILSFWPLLGVQFGRVKYIHIAVQPSPLPISRTFSLSQTETLYLLNSNSLFPTPRSALTLSNLYFIFVSMSLTTLGVLYKWYHTGFVFLWLTYFT